MNRFSHVPFVKHDVAEVIQIRYWTLKWQEGSVGYNKCVIAYLQQSLNEPKAHAVNVAKQVPKELPGSLLSDTTNKYKIYLCETNRRIHRRSRGYQSPEGYQMTWYPHSKKTRSYPATKNNWRSHTLHLTDPDVYFRAQKIVNGVNLDASTAREVNPPLSKKLRNLRVQFQIGILNNTAYRTCNKKTWRRLISDRFSNLI